jgi:branched-chain amino acid transport system ATP-binding protein
MVRTFQHIRLFPKMTVLENVMVGRHVHSRAGFLSGMLNLPFTWREERSIREKSQEILELLGIAEHARTEAVSLAYGQQRVVEIGRALACEPRLLLLDEPAAGLNMRETNEMGRLIEKIRDMGITVLLVEHDMSLVMGISDEIVVLSFGQKIAEDRPLAIQKNREVIRVYLGDDA